MSEVVVTLYCMTLNEPVFPRFVYVPWSDNEPHQERASQAVSIAKAVAAKAQIPVQGVAATAQQLPMIGAKLHTGLESRAPIPHLGQ